MELYPEEAMHECFILVYAGYAGLLYDQRTDLSLQVTITSTAILSHMWRYWRSPGLIRLDGVGGLSLKEVNAIMVEAASQASDKLQTTVEFQLGQFVRQGGMAGSGDSVEFVWMRRASSIVSVDR